MQDRTSKGGASIVYKCGLRTTLIALLKALSGSELLDKVFPTSELSNRRGPHDFVKIASITLRRKIVLGGEVTATLALSMEGHFEKPRCCARVFYRQGKNIFPAFCVVLLLHSDHKQMWKSPTTRREMDWIPESFFRAS
uniref:Uncharacterized protein n=1 Tax=Romanomermis culicivorax TaxID=13658 RepID=A0A915HF41_ROMCU